MARHEEPATIVFFDHDSAVLSPAGAEVVELLMADLIELDWQEVRLEGHTDASSDAAYAVGLSQRMAAAVRDHLVSRGIAASRIQVVGMGSTSPLVPTEPGATEPVNRRVEIYLSD